MQASESQQAERTSEPGCSGTVTLDKKSFEELRASVIALKQILGSPKEDDDGSNPIDNDGDATLVADSDAETLDADSDVEFEDDEDICAMAYKLVYIFWLKTFLSF